MEFECHKCGTICEIDGDWPKYFCWCDTCNNYAEGFDAYDCASDIMASKIDYYHDKIRDEGLGPK